MADVPEPAPRHWRGQLPAPLWPVPTIKEADPRVHSNACARGAGRHRTARCRGIPVAGCGQARALEALRSSPIGVGIAAACAAIAIHGLVDSFMSFTGTYILMAVALGLASASARERGRRAHRI